MAALAPFYPVQCDRVMFIYIIKVNIGDWWLSIGFRFGVKPFLFAWFPSGIKEVFLRFLWPEVAVSELPFFWAFPHKQGIIFFVTYFNVTNVFIPDLSGSLECSLQEIEL